MTTYRRKEKKFTLESYNGKLPPSDLDIEEVVLGTILLDNSVLDKFIGEFNVSLFFNDEYNKIANAIIQLYSRNVGVDLITVKNECKRLGYEIPIVNIVSLTNRVGSSTRFEFHFRILQENSIKRDLIQVCSDALRRSFENTEDVYKIIVETQSKLEGSFKNIASTNLNRVGVVHKKLLEIAWTVVLEGKRSGVPTGLRLLDNVTNGWQNSDLIILAGRPSMGKTACAISMIMHPALNENIPIAIFSLEMSSEQLVGRMQSYMSGVNVGRIVKKQLTKEEIVDIQGDAFKLEDAKLFIDDTASITLAELKSKARRLHKEEGIRLIVIDYLQLMRSGLQTFSRENEIAEISRGLKALAKELDIPVIALSQLSRGVESRGGDKKPQLSDLRESGQIEQDADMVLFCYRPEYYGIENYEIGERSFDAHGLFMLLINKHRNGELGEIPLQFIHEQAKITNLNFDNNNISSTFVQANELAPQQPSVLVGMRNELFDETDEKPF
jgi:replicative DNA helicase